MTETRSAARAAVRAGRRRRSRRHRVRRLPRARCLGSAWIASTRTRRCASATGRRRLRCRRSHDARRRRRRPRSPPSAPFASGHPIRAGRNVQVRSFCPDVVRRRTVDDENIEVAVAVEVRHQGLSPVALAAQSHLGGKATKGTVAVVAEQLVAVGPDGQHVQIAVVIGIDQGAGVTGFLAENSLRGPGGSRVLSPDPCARRAAEHDVDEAVVVDVAPKRRCGRVGLPERMVGENRDRGALSGCPASTREMPPPSAPDPAGAVAIHVRSGDGTGVGPVGSSACGAANNGPWGLGGGIVFSGAVVSASAFGPMRLVGHLHQSRRRIRLQTLVVFKQPCGLFVAAGAPQGLGTV